MPNKQHMPAVEVKAPLGDKTRGTPGPAPAPPTMQGYPHRPEKAYSSQLPPPMVNSGESHE
jgi:hypothetical protein